jgi:glycoprotein endo-alpha-1,2-mannosidase
MRQLRAAVILLILALTLVANGRVLGQTAMDASAAEKTRYDGTVAIWYGSHFEDTATHDWVPIKEWNGPYHPVLGEYKTDDRKVIQQHLKWLRRAGVDVLCYDLCRIQPELTILELPKQKTLQLLVEELSHQEKETRKLKLVIWMEKWNSNPTPAEYKFGFDYLRKNLADRDFYYRLDGKPLVMTYHNGPAPELAKIDREHEQFFTIRYISPDANTPGWKYFGPLGDKECFTVNPGANGFMEEAFINKNINHQPVDDNALRERGKAAVQQRADGKYFEDQLLKARQSNPKVIFISGWNDWAWCLQIEPAKEYGFKYVDLAARLLGRETETLSYRQSP